MKKTLFLPVCALLGLASCSKSSLDKDLANQTSRIDPTTPANVHPYITDGSEGEGDRTTLATTPYGGVVTWPCQFSDEFNQVYLDNTKWTKRNNPLPTDTPRYFYRTFNNGAVTVKWYQSDDNDVVSVNGGYLRLGALKWVDATGHYLKCASVDTKNLFEHQYGYFEASIKVPNPKTIGSQSAFWLMSDGELTSGNYGHDGNESDIFESSFLLDSVASTIHWDGYNIPGAKAPGKHWKATGLSNGSFHVFGLKWLYNEHKIYYDGVFMKDLASYWPEGVSWVSEYVRLSTAAVWGDAKDNNDYPTATNWTQVNTAVDWVRVYYP